MEILEIHSGSDPSTPIYPATALPSNNQPRALPLRHPTSTHLGLPLGCIHVPSLHQGTFTGAVGIVGMDQLPLGSRLFQSGALGRRRGLHAIFRQCLPQFVDTIAQNQFQRTQ